MEKVRICGEITPGHELSFLFIKGALGCKNNGDAMELMIDRVCPIIQKEIAARKGARGGKQ